MPKQERILGIDPGFGRVGWGVVEKRGGDWVHVAHGCIETDASAAFVDRLKVIESELQSVLEQYAPTIAAVEELFFVKNVTTGINVGQARGVILLTLAHAGLPIHEHTPKEIKQAVTGYGSADKGQMQTMIKLQLQLKDVPKPDDAADALAVALTCGLGLKMNTLKTR